ncbi:50S ribosomal protein L25/general stress protein Ctc [Oscillatoria salina]|uniref:50S ribosomal protein L25/general stress protein Ctc n=1 Tax=Oscillatoria salina TaxID=331517 RepID=UPI0013B7F2DD|nr:50S ribosomal protein L25/general stress protein Ctc [Oscillatoria salina]MBZ8179296.1 50S ribosomal protein L25/general stress protein Ctc [Oscillatoria salina IIICB1]NET86736.1 50S ribosomal protein L25/general stress protein Ctc [Kamptonema sp. SIO1D9]
MQVTVECQKRPEGSKPNALRREGLLPAALYGHNGAESVSLVMNAKEAENLLKKASVNNTLVDLKIPDLSWKGKALIREVQAHPWRRTLYHLSFFAVAGQDSVEVVVPVNLVGEPAGAKEGGILEQIITELKVQCPPGDIPESIEIDVSSFEIGTNIHLSEVVVPEGVTVLDDLDRTVLTVVAPRLATTTEETEETEGILPEVELVASSETEGEEIATEGEEG